MTDPENFAKRICDLLYFRGLVEILDIIMPNHHTTKENIEKESVNYLIQTFDCSLQLPDGLFHLELNEYFMEKTRNMIIEKVKKFLDVYIRGKIHVITFSLDKI